MFWSSLAKASLNSCFYSPQFLMAESRESWVWSGLTRNDASCDVVSPLETTGTPRLLHMIAYLGMC